MRLYRQNPPAWVSGLKGCHLGTSKSKKSPKISLEAAVSAKATQPAFGSQVQEAWNNSTHSLGEFTVGLLKLGIWLLVYSPYLLVLVAAGYGLTRWRRNSQRLVQTPDSSGLDRT
ncbi:hypothetical protein WA1_11590 [Scytonema hofmannii PCC 7110]|uniref:DUF4349 domain-containing protein n=1 Tax=Scytonema hofmannii PCC 7110 TaxID=128403 RepID=A0A139XDJ1_9CYAN|nr:hypothetical protein WA1_11590 [Scytonema hofmannii PCC 7110]